MNLEFTYGKVLSLSDVYFVPEIRKNLMYEGLLNKFSESNQFVLTKRRALWGKDICTNRCLS
jgi:hypothetical protein